MSEARITLVGGRVIVEVHVQPRAARSALVGLHGGRLKVALQAPPVDGAANQALVALFAELLGVTRAQVALVRGEKSRQKTLGISGVSVEQVRALLP